MKDKKIKVVPDNYTAVTPWIISPSSADLIDFLTATFEAEEISNSRIVDEKGVIIHVVIQIADARVMLFDAREGWGPTPSFLNIYVEDVERTYQKALEFGAKSVTEIITLWFGEKVCRILDPFGNLWWINERVEEVDFTDPKIGERAATSDAIEGISYIQKSLGEALISQKEFFTK